ncbi:MAG: 4-(cytidine 5'-diphospho)-2-C-methyl-D-erythritol kinase [Gammaproteobacteria bacterium]|nr:4-(cytidine 5'-diphospho)-2-C-methyl-D-erythritol kinase [Pseudomonadota bacterium]MCH9662377.1 4-(cytidine 5'-diphospho)-2-C-methyl-D-erythritol kinase [Gammaproteobacteria bacterium]
MKVDSVESAVKNDSLDSTGLAANADSADSVIKADSVMLVQSPAKINWFLRLIGEGLDGYHRLQSAMQCIDLCDSIVLTRRSDTRIEFSADTPMDLTGPSLCERAASLLRQVAHYRHGVCIELRRNIPVCAGLGGASSNAAAVLMGLNRLWALNLSREDLLACGRRLGSDVAFFIAGACAWVEGDGGTVYPWAGAEIPLLLYTGGQGFSTPARYNHPDLPRRQEPVYRDGFDGRRPQQLIDLGNAFEILSRQHDATTEQIIGLAGRYGRSFMTGSGSCIVCALDENHPRPAEAAAHARTELAATPGLQGWNVLVTRTRTSSPLHDSLKSYQ